MILYDIDWQKVEELVKTLPSVPCHVHSSHEHFVITYIRSASLQLVYTTKEEDPKKLLLGELMRVVEESPTFKAMLQKTCCIDK